MSPEAYWLATSPVSATTVCGASSPSHCGVCIGAEPLEAAVDDVAYPGVYRMVVDLYPPTGLGRSAGSSRLPAGRRAHVV